MYTFSDSSVGASTTGAVAAGGGEVDMATMNLYDLFYMVMYGRVDGLEEEVRKQAGIVEGYNKKLKDLQILQNQLKAGQVTQFETQPFSQPIELPSGSELIDLGNGYGVVIELGENAKRSFMIVEFNTDQNGGPVPLNLDGTLNFKSSSRIWGDPHVTEGATGDDWQFKEQVTFLLPDGTKITVETSPSAAYPGQTYASKLYISRGHEQALITGLEDNMGFSGQENDTIDVVSDGTLFSDKQTNDGLLIVAKNGGIGDWEELDGTDVTQGSYMADTVTQAEYLSIPLTDGIKDLLEQGAFDYLPYTHNGALVLDVVNDKEVIDQIHQALNTLKDSLTSTSQLDQVKLQSNMGKYNQSFEMLSNFIKTYFSSINSIIRNQGA